MITSIIYGIGGFIEGIIGLRFLLRLLGANPATDFVRWIYDWSTPFVRPFAGIFGQNASVTGRGVVTSSVFDWSALIALLVIGLIVGVLGNMVGRRHYLGN